MEICICAAIQTAEGILVRGHRHCDCILTAMGIRGVNMSRAREAVQGFMTSANRFVDRYEGMRLQRAAGAKSACYGELQGDMLFSEDLY